MTTPSPFSLTGDLPYGTCVLEASAGTGKTYALAGLATRYIAEGVVTLDHLMLVTFSRAATAELRDRVRDRLRQLHRALARTAPSPDSFIDFLCACTGPERINRLERVSTALRDFDSAMIATTHEFCHAMVTELGILADPEPIPDFVEDLRPLARDVVHDLYVARFAQYEQTPFTFIEALTIGDEVAENNFADITVVTEPAGAKERSDFAQAVRAEIQHRCQRAGIYTFDDMLNRLFEALNSPDTGTAACHRLAQRFPIVMIDEFQDTDPLQWNIMTKAFLGQSTVVLIGDPKQAIYAFRGADVYSYLDATDQVRSGTITGSWQTLDTNFRTDSRLVSALGELFYGAALGEDSIAVYPVSAHQENPRLSAPAPWDQPLRIRAKTCDPTTTQGLPRVDEARAGIAEDLVADIVALLGSNAQLTLTEAGPEPIRPRHLAILVSGRPFGRLIRDGLIDAGVPTVFAGADSVIASTNYRNDGATRQRVKVTVATPAALSWLTVLNAVANPSSGTIRHAALTDLIGWTMDDLASVDEAALTHLRGRIHAWGITCAERGSTAAIDQIMADYQVVSRLLSQPQGERRLTDLRHIAQLLQSELPERSSAMELCAWLREQISHGDDRSDTRVQRLETDADAVQILTIHSAKGLQFPIVYLPDACLEYRPSDEGAPLLYHDDHGGRCLDVAGKAGTGRRDRWMQAEREDGGDSLRKLYVALTRAECQVTTWWYPTTASLSYSPLQRLLFRTIPDDGFAVPSRSYPDLDLNQSPVLRQHHQLVQPCQHKAGPSILLDADPDIANLSAATFTRRIDHTWRRTSYSALTAAAHDLAPNTVPMESDEPEIETIPDTPSPTDSFALQPSPMADFGGGTQFGTLTHAVLEQLDPQHDDLLGQLSELLAAATARVPVADLDIDAYAQALLLALHTPLGPLAQGRCLTDFSIRDRCAELDFDMVLGPRALTLAEVAHLLDQHLDSGDLLASYPERLRRPELASQTLHGYLTGSIDAVLRFGSPARYLVVDYKTNRIGPLGADLLVGHYSQHAMAQAMMDSHYPLQALLYQVALHRFLRWRQPDYDPQIHLGGVLYLFLRGMAGPSAVISDGPDAGLSYGAFSWQPPADLIIALSDAIGGDLN
ncbi:MAG: UvrD-helicase domain-containing protein [Propionibacteriaceae bacterium]